MIFLMTQDVFKILNDSCQENAITGVFITVTFPGLICSFAVLLCFLKELIFSIKKCLLKAMTGISSTAVRLTT